MIIGTCGFAFTGSGAVLDYLKEFSTLCVFDQFELNIAYYPNGLEDLDYHLNQSCSKYLSSTVAIDRFKMVANDFLLSKVREKTQKEAIEYTINRYLDNIIQVSWKGWGKSDYQTIIGQEWFHHFFIWLYNKSKGVVRRTERHSISTSRFLEHQMYLSICPDGFYDATKQFVSEIVHILIPNCEKGIVLDQPFSGNNPQKSFVYFDDPYAVVVDRDPRDCYLFAKEFLKKKGKGRMIPTDNVRDFVIYYKKLRENQPYRVLNNRVLNVRFEDMVYRYQETIHQINEFLHLNDADRDKKVFCPDKSIANTQLFTRFPEYNEDIRYIESCLPDYLYPFHLFPGRKASGTMFA